MMCASATCSRNLISETSPSEVFGNGMGNYDKWRSARCGVRRYARQPRPSDWKRIKVNCRSFNVSGLPSTWNWFQNSREFVDLTLNTGSRGQLDDRGWRHARTLPKSLPSSARVTALEFISLCARYLRPSFPSDWQESKYWERKKNRFKEQNPAHDHFEKAFNGIK